MQIVEVNDPGLEKEFIHVNVRLYATDKNYIRPLDQDVKQVFDAAKNKLLTRGKCKRWLLRNDAGTYIGRIAAFVDPGYKNKGDAVKVGGFGFFECINDPAAAALLFSTAKNWLMEMGVEAMDGPINFGDRNKWWGLVIEGFHSPLYGMPYNYPYYQQLFESYGFEVFYYQLCWHLKVDTRLPEKFYRAHEKHSINKGIRVEKITKSKLDAYADDFVTIYNQAWAKHEGNKQMTTAAARKLFRSMKFILDTDLAWFTYYKDQPIAMWLNIPDLNQIFKNFNGQLTAWHKLKLLWMIRRKQCTRFVGIIYGIVPEWQGTGIDYYMIVEAAKVIQGRSRYKELELQWQGDFNPKMLSISKNLGCSLSRKLATYRYQFDPEKEFKRHPVIM